MLSAESICRLMPHAGSMCLIEKLLQWDDESILCSTQSHLRNDNPLRKQDRLNAIHAAEYGAQAMALHGGLLAQRSGNTTTAGLLVSLRGVKLYRQRLDDTKAPLLIFARQLLADGGNLLYAFRLTLSDSPVAEGKAAVIAHKE